MDEEQMQTIFRERKAEDLGIAFSNDIQLSDSVNIISYLYAYNGGGVGLGDFNNDGFTDIFLCGNRVSNKLYVNKGSWQFEDITESAGLSSTDWSTGVTIADVNQDGWLDIYVCQISGIKYLNGRNRLYINNKDLSFTEQASLYGLDFSGLSTHAAFFDYDRDGDLDMYLLNHSVHKTSSYQDTSIRRIKDLISGDRLYRNDNMKFVDVSKSAGIYSSPVGYGLGLAISDFNNDNWPDIYVGNDFHENDYLYINQKNGKFIERSEAALNVSSQFSMGCYTEDLNDDGYSDIFTLDMKPFQEDLLKQSPNPDPLHIYSFKSSYGYQDQLPRNALQFNSGVTREETPHFIESAISLGLDASDWSWSPLIADFDMDGDKDIFISNGILKRPNDLDYLNYLQREGTEDDSDFQLAANMPDGKVKNLIFIHESNGTFSRLAFKNVSLSNSAMFDDMDNDGDLDIICNNLNSPPAIYENLSADWRKENRILLNIPETNTGIVSVYSGSKVQRYMVQPRLSFMASGRNKLSVAVPSEIKLVDSIVVSIDKDSIAFSYNILPGSVIEYSDMTKKYLSLNRENVLHDVSWERSCMDLNHIHQENVYDDYIDQKLIPYSLSRSGPVLAAGDVDRDGMEDLYIGGSLGNIGRLYLRKKNAFVQDTSAFLYDREFEDTDALFMDINNDGWLDLVVVSGGSQHENDMIYRSRIYKNDGRGNLKIDQQALPEFHLNASVVDYADIDSDGDFDLFVGGRSVLQSYGLSSHGILLINDGTGSFDLDSSELQKTLYDIGMISAASFGNLDEDESEELIIAGEWMDIKIVDFDNREIKTISNSSGLWQGLLIDDYDLDGDPDIILGNIGTNTCLSGPANLYIGDFDQNGKAESIITYFRSGREYSLYGLDFLMDQLPLLRKHFRNYHEFSQQSFDRWFPKLKSENHITKHAMTMKSSLLINEGMGRFDLKELPEELQLSSIHTIKAIGRGNNKLYFFGGNDQIVQPSLGKLNNSFGYFTRCRNGRLSVVGSADIKGDIRDVVILDDIQDYLMFVGVNGKRLESFCIEKE